MANNSQLHIIPMLTLEKLMLKLILCLALMLSSSLCTAMTARDIRKINPRLTLSESQQIVDSVNVNADKNGIPRVVIFRIIYVESTFNPRVPYGLMGLQNPKLRRQAPRGSIEANIAVGVSYLAKQRRLCRGDLSCALTRYNGSRKYVRKIL